MRTMGIGQSIHLEILREKICTINKSIGWWKIRNLSVDIWRTRQVTFRCNSSRHYYHLAPSCWEYSVQRWAGTRPKGRLTITTRSRLWSGFTTPLVDEDAEQYGLLTVNPILSPLVRQWMEESTNDFSYSSGVQTIPEGRLILSVVCGRSADQDSAERKEENQAFSSGTT